MPAVLKTAMGSHPSWVRIPRPPLVSSGFVLSDELWRPGPGAVVRSRARNVPVRVGRGTPRSAQRHTFLAAELLLPGGRRRPAADPCEKTSVSEVSDDGPE